MLDKLIDLKKVTHIRKDTGGGGEEGGKGTRISKWGGGECSSSHLGGVNF